MSRDDVTPFGGNQVLRLTTHGSAEEQRRGEVGINKEKSRRHRRGFRLSLSSLRIYIVAMLIITTQRPPFTLYASFLITSRNQKTHTADRAPLFLPTSPRQARLGNSQRCCGTLVGPNPNSSAFQISPRHLLFST